MSTPVDTRRTVALQIVADIDAPDVGPGCAMRLRRSTDGVLWGYVFSCPGCGQQSGLPLAPGDATSPRWTVASGDPETGAGLTLSPSIWHKAGCGWHGYLQNGQFVPI